MKKSSRQRSFLAILFITLSLSATLIATSPPLEGFVASVPHLEDVLTAAATLLLIFAVLFGKGVLFGRKRDEWLMERLVAERIRQLYFQFLLASAEAICSTSFIERQRAFDDRQQTLERILRRLRTPAYRQTVRDDATLHEGLLLDIPEWKGGQIDNQRYAEFKLFWEELRFDWQTKYSTGELDRKASAFPLFGSLADQEHTVNTLEFIASLGIIVCQMLAVSSQILWSESSSQTQVFVLIASLLAIAVVGLQAYKEGMGLSSDLSRNRAYATYSAKLTRDFKAAGMQGDRQAELQAMKEMETLAYFETREFLNAHSRTQFSL